MLGKYASNVSPLGAVGRSTRPSALFVTVCIAQPLIPTAWKLSGPNEGAAHAKLMYWAIE